MAFQLPRRLAATAVLAALALPALAQQQQPPANPPAAAERPHAHPKRPHGDCGPHNPAQRLANLKAKLQLTPAQEPAWTTFTAALQPAERPAPPDPKEWRQLTTPERIDRMRAQRTQRATEADRRDEATKAFYAALTPEQQKTFDAQPPRPPHRGRPGGPEHRHPPRPAG
ncbi:MAG: Spy/CpxP family protein refolding chaperone [Acidovorax sp.]|uniref:Spy/CpxP family protein refolding chaperone n=1 Tax=Acidovorax sp. TaxID=1872122 RepID=UPI0039E63E60